MTVSLSTLAFLGSGDPDDKVLVSVAEVAALVAVAEAAGELVERLRRQGEREFPQLEAALNRLSL